MREREKEGRERREREGRGRRGGREERGKEEEGGEGEKREGRRGGREERGKEEEGEEENVTSEHSLVCTCTNGSVCSLDGVTPRDLVLRVQNLEMRLLELEARSIEYHHPEVWIISSVCSTDSPLYVCDLGGHQVSSQSCQRSKVTSVPSLCSYHMTN